MRYERMEKRILITEPMGEARIGEPLRVGVPFACGELETVEHLVLSDAVGAPVPVQAAALKQWKDGSVKWALLDFTATVPGGGSVAYTLSRGETRAADGPAPITIITGDDEWRIDTGAALFHLDTRQMRPLTRVVAAGRDGIAPSGGSCFLKLEDNRTLAPFIERVHTESPGPLRAIIRLEGRFGPAGESSPRFTSRIHFFSGTSRVLIEFTLLNPRPAVHPGGLWDLGDPGSLVFSGLSCHIPLADGSVDEIICSPESGMEPARCLNPDDGLSVYQESSGGANWQSPIHRDRTGLVPMALRGYELNLGNGAPSSGERATPLVWCGTGERGVSVVVPLFWQEFPTAIEADRSGLSIELFPARFPGRHELQGGEQKTFTMHLDFAASPAGLNWARAPLNAVVDPEVHRRAGVLMDLPPAEGADGDGPDLVDRFVPGPEALIRKREEIDEYGWRNYGELYADHEAVYHRGDAPLISHYNNQYDPCAGMYRKFFATGNPLWGRLAAELARHVLDIDLYHCDHDREEYNRGLFWHTDHYLDAGLGTHRSFSREHLKVKDPRFCGGGPGAEHCYTSGLMIHYFQTGDPAFRDAVVSLAEWAIRSLAGPFTVLAAMKRGTRHIAQLRRVNGGIRPLFPRYPLTRGTGNTINACLDAYEVGGGDRFLERAEELIRGTLHPDDDIDARNLLNAEIAWSYTVLLVAVAKYLDKKRELGRFDAGYAHARASLLAYAEWMLRHEYPYLEKPEILEYPNETWAAQDLRKSVVFYHAARHAPPELRQAFVERGKYFFTAASQELSRHVSSRFTRPVALMLQNGWVGSRLGHEIPSVLPETIPEPSGPPTPRLGIGSVAARIAGDLFSAARVTSLRREMSWLKARLG